MTDAGERHTDEVARSVFAGLIPQGRDPRRREHGRPGRAVFSTGSVLLVGSMAAMTLNLTGPVEPAEAAQNPRPKGSATDFGKTVGESIAAASARTAAASVEVASAQTVSAPTVYVVAAGDTVSSIAGQYGISTASVLALNGLGWSSLIFPGQELKLTSAGAVAPVAVETAAPTSDRYTIVSGDTISAIASRFGVAIETILAANGLGWSSIIYPGQTLSIPGSDDIASAPTQEQVAEPVAERPVAEDADGPGGEYTIVEGDTIGSIAESRGVEVQALLDANGLDRSSIIYAGDTLSLPGAASPAAVTTAWVDDSIDGLDGEMRQNADVIVQVGRELGVSDFGIVIALATAMQESGLRNLDWGDRDSVGLFQQRPSAGWGTVDELTTPRHAAQLFYGGDSNPNRGLTEGLLDISDWESLSLTDAAQSVQRSAYPDAYAKWESAAWTWLAELG